jgi:7-carboxy-7-deazaguanine synthase
MKLRLLEHYVSTQGEGPKVGVLTQFVRFAGCNLKCAKWACDTPYAIDPKLYRTEQVPVSYEELAEKIVKQYVATGATNVCFTGGEPLLQPQDALAATIDELLKSYGFLRFEMFTNGTKPIIPDLIDEIDFVMDWKLPGSGEDPNNQERIENLKVIDTGNNSVKFTVADVDDLNMASDIWADHLMESPLQVFVGAVWGKIDNAVILDFIKAYRLPWRLNVQTHNYIYGGPTQRGI